MATVNYKDLDLKKDKSIKIFKWKNNNIEIVNYLPIEDKYDIVMITLQKSLEDGIYNSIKLDMFFHLNLIYMYTNIIFTDEERENETKLYDELKSSGFMNEFLKNINADEYKELQETVEEIGGLRMKYNTTAASVLRNLIDDLPANAEAAQKIVENFDSNKYQAVVDFAKAANGNREIK